MQKDLIQKLVSYGHENTTRDWLKQFMGFKGESSLEPETDIDIISKSVHAITRDVQWKTKMLQQLVQQFTLPVFPIQRFPFACPPS